MNAPAWLIAPAAPARGVVVRWRAARAIRRWPLWWSATLDSGRRSQDLWTAPDWRLWCQALAGVTDLNHPLPLQAPALGWTWPHTATLAQRRYQRLDLAGYTPLCLALRLRDPAPFQALLDAGANPALPGTPDGVSAVNALTLLGETYRNRGWSVRIAGATPQPWHSLMQHKLASLPA